MSVEDKARNSRACLLVLNTCPVGMRPVIEHNYTTHGYTGFDIFLDYSNNKHQLFHLRFQKCCLVHCYLKNSCPSLHTDQWNLLYKVTSTRNPHGDRGKCPCMYTAIPGVTTHDMDVTLCCLLLRNICPGVNISHIEDICTVRNQLIHARSAILDETSFNDVWTKVETALLSLTSCLSASFQSELQNCIQETRSGFCDLSDLDNLMAHERRIVNLEESQEDYSQKLEALATDTRRIEGKIGSDMSQTCIRIDDIIQRMTAIEEDAVQRNIRLEINISHTHQAIKDFESKSQRLQAMETDLNDIQGRIVDIERSISDIQQQQSIHSDKQKERVLEAVLTIHKRATANIQISPLHGSHGKIDISQVYMTPRISKMPMTDDTYFRNKTEIMLYGPDDDDDLFHKNGKFVRYVFLQGEPGHGKTIFCQNLVREWCMFKESEEDENMIVFPAYCLDQIDFVFMIALKHVQKSGTCLVDIICDEVSKHFGSLTEDIKYVIASEKYRCLITIDGLDEWNISQEVIGELTNKPIPNIGCTSTCSSSHTDHGNMLKYREKYKHATMSLGL